MNLRAGGLKSRKKILDFICEWSLSLVLDDDSVGASGYLLILLPQVVLRIAEGGHPREVVHRAPLPDERGTGDLDLSV